MDEVSEGKGRSIVAFEVEALSEFVEGLLPQSLLVETKCLIVLKLECFVVRTSSVKENLLHLIVLGQQLIGGHILFVKAVIQIFKEVLLLIH